MAVLFAAGELESFTRSLAADVAPVTDTTRYDQAVARQAIGVDNGAFIRADLDAEATTVWLHFRVYHLDHANVSNTGQLARLVDSTGPQVGLQLDYDAGVLNLEYWDGAAFQTVGAAIGVASDTLETIDVEYVVSDTGRVAVYLNGSSSAAASADVDTLVTGVTGVDRVELSNGGASASGRANFSEVVVADEDTRGWRLQTMDPTADGFNTAWGGTFAEVDELEPDDDTTAITADASTQVETFVCRDIDSSLAGLAVKGVTVGFRAKRGAAGPQNLQAATRFDGTNYNSASVAALDVSYAPRNVVFATNPGTAAAWSQSEANAAEFGLRSET